MARKSFNDMVKVNARQVASGLLRAIATAHGLNLEQRRALKIRGANLHYHGDEGTQIAWNDVEAIIMYNEHTGENIPVPLMASEGYNDHDHSSPYTGGYLPGSGPHDHRDNFNGGFAFAIFHPGTGIPQMPFAL